MAAGSLDTLFSRLPRSFDLDWTARRYEALLRRREIKSAKVLLHLALAYAGGGLSLRDTAAWAARHGLARVSDVAVFDRADDSERDRRVRRHVEERPLYVDVTVTARDEEPRRHAVHVPAERAHGRLEVAERVEADAAPVAGTTTMRTAATRSTMPSTGTGMEVTALHSHMHDDQPRLFFDEPGPSSAAGDRSGRAAPG
jgi:hypothetical protein